jgi:predicted DNA-binding transcriptional regulator AlpA
MRNLPELAGFSEVADICGVTKTTALRYVKRADFPDPIGRVAAGPIWKAAEVKKWAQKTLPLAVGRPTDERR